MLAGDWQRVCQCEKTVGIAEKGHETGNLHIPCGVKPYPLTSVHAERVSVKAQCHNREAFDGTRKGAYSECMMKRSHPTITRGTPAMPKKIQFEWELPDTLV